MLTYKEIQRAVGQVLSVRPSSVKTCWIADVKREMGLTRGIAPNTGQGVGAPTCPEKYKREIKKVLS
ncbi:MAG TPA: hypothetical protein VKB26_03765 [Candidatus Acidoferrales bacterium]|nr:hypothetical protein [Candidatus Acidoferrales bacterium]